jgi:hypothetical protein
MAEVGAGVGRTLREIVVEAQPLGHVHERPPASARVRSAVPQAQVGVGDDLLDNRVDAERDETSGASGDPTAAGLVAWKTRAVE